MVDQAEIARQGRRRSPCQGSLRKSNGHDGLIVSYQLCYPFRTDLEAMESAVNRLMG